MDFLRKFFDVFARFDWDEQIITIYGAIRKQGLKWQDRLKDEFNFDIQAMAMSERQVNHSADETCLIVGPSELAPLIDKYAAFRLLSFCDGVISNDQPCASDIIYKFKKTMNPKLINIVDPCYSKNNLGRSISVFNSFRLKEAIKMQDEGFKKILQRAETKHTAGKDPTKYLIKEYCKIFKYTLECTGKLPPINLKLPQMSLKGVERQSHLEEAISVDSRASLTKLKNKGLKTKLFDEKTDMFDFGDDIGNKDYSDIDDFDTSEVHQLINNFTSPQKHQQEEAKLNPEADPVREYVVKCLIKLARYDKQTVLQLVRPELDDDETELSKEMNQFREFGFSESELAQLAKLIDEACVAKQSESQFNQILDSSDSSTVPIDLILRMINEFSTSLKFLEPQSGYLKSDPKTRDLLFRAM